MRPGPSPLPQQIFPPRGRAGLTDNSHSQTTFLHQKRCMPDGQSGDRLLSGLLRLAKPLVVGRRFPLGENESPARWPIIQHPPQPTQQPDALGVGEVRHFIGLHRLVGEHPLVVRALLRRAPASRRGTPPDRPARAPASPARAQNPECAGPPPISVDDGRLVEFQSTRPTRGAWIETP